MFFNFLNFFAIFLEFSITGRVGIDRIDKFYFLSFHGLSQFVLALKEAVLVFFNFFIFFALFLEFFIMGRVGIERNDNFHFHSFLGFPNLFWHQKKV